MHPEGELATVRGAGMTGVHFVVSTNTTVQSRTWRQSRRPPSGSALFAERPKDRGFTQELIQRGRGCRVRQKSEHGD